jgi:hypothetical protein
MKGHRPVIAELKKSALAALDVLTWFGVLVCGGVVLVTGRTGWFLTSWVLCSAYSTWRANRIAKTARAEEEAKWKAQVNALETQMVEARGYMAVQHEQLLHLCDHVEMTGYTIMNRNRPDTSLN